MKHNNATKIIGLALLMFVLLLIAAMAGLRVNISDSLPPGLYWLNTQKEAHKGDIVFFCPPNNTIFQMAKQRGYLSEGSCPGGYKPLIKKMRAVAGDLVARTQQGILINQILQKNSGPIHQDAQGDLLPNVLGKHPLIVPKAHALFLSDYNPMSFDGRYFGVIHIGYIQGVATPIFTW